MVDGLFTFGTLETVEIPAAGPGSANDATPKSPLGVLYRHNGNVYRYVKFDNGSGNVAAAANGAAHWKTLSPTTGVFTVTSDQTDAIGGINTVAGIFGCVVTDLYYTWVQVGGVAPCKVNSGTTAGDKMIGSTSDLTLDHIADGSNVTDAIFGVALDAYDTDGTALVLLQNLMW